MAPEDNQSEVLINGKGGHVTIVNSTDDGAEKSAPVEKVYLKAAPRRPGQIRLFKRRWFMLSLFCALSMANAFQWIEYSIITNIIIHYYDVSSLAVDWTSMIYMLTYIPFVFPSMYVLDRFGLKISALLGAFGNCLGSWIKVCSVRPDLFAISFLGQTIAGSSQCFTLGLPPRLAAVWFGPKEVSTATAIGVFGNQLGIAIGFLVPPLVVKDTTKLEIESGLLILFGVSAALNTILFLATILFFEDNPPCAPSPAQHAAIEATMDSNYSRSLKELVKHRDYMLLVLTYGLNVGVFYAVSTLLNQMVLLHYEKENEKVGTIGLLIIISGMVGSIATGVVLDKTKKFKLTTVVVYLFSAVGMAVYTFTLDKGIWTVFISACLLGFFMTGYLPLGFEFGAEITYPISEGTVSGLLNVAAQVFGIAITLTMGIIFKKYGALACNISMTVVLAVGTVLTALIRGRLKRQEAGRDDFLRLDLNLVHHDTPAYLLHQSDTSQSLMLPSVNVDGTSVTFIDAPNYDDTENNGPAMIEMKPMLSRDDNNETVKNLNY